MSTTDPTAAPLPQAGGSYVRDAASGELSLSSGTELPEDRATTEPDALGTARPAPAECAQFEAPAEAGVLVIHPKE